MPAPQARLEIEQTLRASRDSTELRIAWGRIALFGLGLVASILIDQLSNNRHGPVLIYSVGVMAVACVYAAAILLFARKRGATRGLMLTVVALDMVAMGAIFAVTRLMTGPPSPDQLQYRSLFPTYILPAALFSLTLLNSLRYSRASAVVGALAGQAVYWSIALWIMEPHPGRPVAGALLLLAGAISYSNAVRARESLNTFARLQLLRRYLSPAAVQRVLESNPDQALALGGEIITVTLLAADLRDFTAMSEKLSAADVVEYLNEYHGVMLEQVERRGGLLDKFIGDGMLAVFGLGLFGQGRPTDDGASAAVRAAEDMMTALKLLNADRAMRSLPPLKMGIGIHTGPVVAGNIGAPGRRIEFTVIGDSVNTAARLEGLTKQAGEAVVISAETARRLSEGGALKPLPAMKIRGKEEAMALYALGSGSGAVAGLAGGA